MPIPLGLAIAAGAGQLTGGIYNIAAGAKQRREGERLFEQQLEDLRSGKYDLTVSQAQRDVADLARQYGEQRLSDVQRRGAAVQQATLFGLRGGDPRLASTLPSTVAASDRAIYEAGQRAVGSGLEAQRRLAGIEQSILTQNEQARRMLEQMQMQRGAAAGEAGRQQQVSGIGQIASAPMDIAALYVAGSGPQKKGLADDLGDAGAYVKSFDIPDYAGDLSQKFEDLRQKYGLNEDGGKAPMVTPGEFDHDTNPIDMVAEDGTKVGEVTGGELILNPEQSNTIEELVEKGDADALIMYLKDLFEQPQFQES